MKTKAAQRVEIAKDVLKWIKAEKLTIQAHSCYFDAKPINSNYQYVGKQLKQVLPKLKKCTVCALGSLFYANIMRYNKNEIKYGISGVGFSGEIRRTLKMFSRPMMNDIERSFEGNNTYRADNKLHSSETALIHIMNNIISNKGTFKP